VFLLWAFVLESANDKDHTFVWVMMHADQSALLAASESNVAKPAMLVGKS